VGQRVQIVGDDLLVTNPTRVKKAAASEIFRKTSQGEKEKSMLFISLHISSYLFIPLHL
jgi:hypothetical protein